MKKQKKQSNGAENNPTANNSEPRPTTDDRFRQSAEIPPEPNKENPPAEAWTEKELDEMAERAAERALPLKQEEKRIGLAYGRIALENHEEVLNGAKRVPDGEDTYKRLSRKLAELGGGKKSPNRLRALAKAYQLHTELGGEKIAPDLPPDHYVEAAVEGLSLDQKRELLEMAAEKEMSAGSLRKYAKAKLGELGKEPERDASYWRDWVEKSISSSQSILFAARMTVEAHGIEIPSSTRDHLNFLAVFTYQFAHQSRGPEDVK